MCLAWKVKKKGEMACYMKFYPLLRCLRAYTRLVFHADQICFKDNLKVLDLLQMRFTLSKGGFMYLQKESTQSGAPPCHPPPPLWKRQFCCVMLTLSLPNKWIVYLHWLTIHLSCKFRKQFSCSLELKYGQCRSKIRLHRMCSLILIYIVHNSYWCH